MFLNYVSDDDGVGGRGMLAGGIGISIKFVVVVKWAPEPMGNGMSSILTRWACIIDSNT